MRILTLSLNAWNDTMATGNTFSNYFSNAGDDDVFYNLYCRDEPIFNNICTEYFQITEKSILSSILKKEECGKRITTEKQSILTLPSSNIYGNSKTANFLRKRRPAVLLYIREYIWSLNIWKNRKLDEFLKEARPEVIYMHGHNNWYMHKILWYCQRMTGAKVVLFFGDDMWGYKSDRLFQRAYHNRLRKVLKQSIMKADMLLGGSELLCDEYSHMFGRSFYPQFKTCSNISLPNRKDYSNKISIVYAGNLLYGRDKILVDIIGVLDNFVSESDTSFCLHIYSATFVDEKVMKILNNGKTSVFEGARPYTEICEILNKCDLSLFLESFDTENVRQTRLSFSTKIIDYMQASSALLSYGPEDLASVKYISDSGIAFCASTKDSLSEVLSNIRNHPSLLYSMACKKFEFAQANHTKPMLLERMKSLTSNN